MAENQTANRPDTNGEDKPTLEKLIKLMKLTSSPNESEAMSALAIAQRFVEKLGGWESLLRGKVKIIQDPFANMPPPEENYRKREPSSGFPKAPPKPGSNPPPPQRPIPQPQTPPRYYTPPVSPPPPPPPRPTFYQASRKPNKYKGACWICGNLVGVGDGQIQEFEGSWHVTCYNNPNCKKPARSRSNKLTPEQLKNLI